MEEEERKDETHGERGRKEEEERKETEERKRRSGAGGGSCSSSREGRRHYWDSWCKLKVCRLDNSIVPKMSNFLILIRVLWYFMVKRYYIYSLFSNSSVKKFVY